MDRVSFSDDSFFGGDGRKGHTLFILSVKKARDFLEYRIFCSFPLSERQNLLLLWRRNQDIML